MANVYTEQRLIDSTKRTLIKLTGIIDGNNAANLIVVDASTLAYALNVNNQIMVSNTNPKTYYGLSVKRIFGDVNTSGAIKLGWASDSNSDMVILGPTTFDFNFDSNGDNAVIKNPLAANATGDIILTTAGAGSNNSYTLFLDLRKDPTTYDQGQTARPQDFNR